MSYSPFLVWMRGLFLIVGLGIGSCETMSKKPPLLLPATLQPYFSSCDSQEGSADVELSLPSTGAVRAALDWRSGFLGSWEIEVVGSFGEPLLSAASIKKGIERHLELLGPVAGRLPKISISAQNFFEIEGYEVPISVDELPCLLGWRLPKSWLRSVRDYQIDRDRAELTIYQPGRVIVIDVKGFQQFDSAKLCSRFAKSGFSGIFSKELTVCFDHSVKNQKLGLLRGVEGYEVRWTKLM